MRKSSIFFVWMYRVFGILSAIIAVMFYNPAFMQRHDVTFLDMLLPALFFLGIGIVLFSASFLFAVNKTNLGTTIQDNVWGTVCVAGAILSVVSMILLITLS